jgi:hypothetical protein
MKTTDSSTASALSMSERKVKLRQIFARVDSIMNDLRTLSEEAELGEHFSAGYLQMIAESATYSLWKVGEANPSVLQPIASENLVWPVLAMPGELWAKFIRKHLENIQLGKQTASITLDVLDKRYAETKHIVFNKIISLTELRTYFKYASAAFDKNELRALLKEAILENHKPRQFANATSANQKQLDLFSKKLMELGELNPTNLNDWFYCVWTSVLFDYQGFPEQDSELRKIGKYRETHAAATPGTKHAESNIREGIKLKLKQALENMVKNNMDASNLNRHINGNIPWWKAISHR